MRQSDISQYSKCPYSYYLKNKFSVIPDYKASDARTIGTALHMAIESDLDKAINWYYSQFYVINDLHINEVIKLEILVPKVKEILNKFSKCKHEVFWEYDNWTGTVDLIADNGVYDFKYSNNIEAYLKSAQLHIYTYFLRKSFYKIDKIGFIFIPKIQIRQKKSEDLYQFRKRLENECTSQKVQLIEIEYDESKVKEAFEVEEEIMSDYEFCKKPSKLCMYCDFQIYCEGEIDYMLLPNNSKKTVTVNTTPDMWLYGNSYSGKTVFMDSFDDVLMLNTDGNVDHITSPVIAIKDIVTSEGRIVNRKYAWEVFKETLTELEKKQNTFKIIVIDLLEDLYEHCRVYTYHKLGIEHESDSGYGKGYDMIKTEFLSTMKRFKNAGYQIVFISKEVKSEISKKSNEKITSIKPNINDKIANIISGMVDLTARVVAEGNERYLNFKTSEFIFGGGRYNFGIDKIELNKDKFIEALTKSQPNIRRN